MSIIDEAKLKRAQAFIEAMRREWAKLYTDVRNPPECPVRNIEDYPPNHRAALARALQTVVQAETV